jgi:DNA-binding protein YbaB
MTDPEQILTRYEGTLAEAQRRSDAIRDNLSSLRVTERSPDGQITVTVNDAGNLVHLTLGNALQRKDGTTVGQDVLRTIQAAQSRIADTVQEAMTPLIGADSEAMRFMVDNLRSAHPAPPTDNGWGTTESSMGTIEDESPPPRQPPPRPPTPRDDEDFNEGGFLR